MAKKILIVDDNSELVNVLRVGFKEAGFTVGTAGSGVDALKKVRTFSPHAIILDLVLPELDGFAVCETLKRNRATASIPILVLTGLSSQLSRFAGLESGADEFLTKPVSFKDVLARINTLLQKAPVPETQPAAGCATA